MLKKLRSMYSAQDITFYGHINDETEYEAFAKVSPSFSAQYSRGMGAGRDRGQRDGNTHSSV